MLKPFIELIFSIFEIISFLVFAWVIVTMLLQFEVINRRNRLIYMISSSLDQLCEPMVRPFRTLQYRLLPNLRQMDLSPLMLLLALQFVRNAFDNWLVTPLGL